MKTVENTFYFKKAPIALSLLLLGFGMSYFARELFFLSSNELKKIVYSLGSVPFLAVLPLALVKLWLPFAEINSRHLFIRPLFRRKKIGFESILDIELLGPDYFSLVFVDAGKKAQRLYLRSIKNLHKLIEQIESKLSASHSLDGIEREILPKKERTRQLFQRQEKEKAFICFFPKKSSVDSALFYIFVVYFLIFVGILLVFSLILLFVPHAAISSANAIRMVVFIVFFILLTGSPILFFSRKQRLSIVTLTPTHLEIQRGWEAPIYRISYTNIVSMEFAGSSNALIHVDVDGETKRVRMPIGVFAKADQKKIMNELRKRTQLPPVTETGQPV